MKTLKEIMTLSEPFGISDNELITIYLSQDGMLSTGIRILTDLTELQSKRLSKELDHIKGLMSNNGSYYYEQFDITTAGNLDSLTRKMMLGYEFDEKDKQFMKDFKLPDSGPFYHDLYEAIKAEQDPEYKPKYYNK